MNFGFSILHNAPQKKSIKTHSYPSHESYDGRERFWDAHTVALGPICNYYFKRWLGRVCTMPPPLRVLKFCSSSIHFAMPPLRVTIPPSILRTGDVPACDWPTGCPLLAPILLCRGDRLANHPHISSREDVKLALGLKS